MVKKRKPFQDSIRLWEEKYDQVGVENKTADQNYVIEKLNTFNKNILELYHDYLRANPKSYLGFYTLRRYIGIEFDFDVKEAEEYFNNLPPVVKTWPAAIEFKETLEVAKKIAIGAQAPDIIVNDTSGHPVSLSTFKGQFVLVDFWASWCPPCRIENINLVKVYSEYRDKNFTILSVSMDRPGKKDDWLQAVRKDGLIWTNVSELLYVNGPVAKTYGINITGLPYNYLVSPEGLILAKNLRREKLIEALQKFIK